MQLNITEVRILVGAHCLCVSPRSNSPLLNHPCASLTHFLRLVKCRDTSYMTAITQSSNFVQLSSAQKNVSCPGAKRWIVFFNAWFHARCRLAKPCLHLLGLHYIWLAGVIQVKKQVQPQDAWRTVQTDKSSKYLHTWNKLNFFPTLSDVSWNREKKSQILVSHNSTAKCGSSRCMHVQARCVQCFSCHSEKARNETPTRSSAALWKNTSSDISVI